MRRRLTTGLAALALAGAAVVTPGYATAPAPRDVLFVGNNWDGTVEVVSAEGGLTSIGRINAVPDRAERMREIYANPVRLAYFLGIRALVGEGHDQFVDDAYSVQDGRLLVVSRPSFADVVAIDIAGGELVWRFAVDGRRSDHMAISPDGTEVAVSASTGNVVHLLDVATGRETGRFPSGDSPHENVYSADGRWILHASIGHVYSPLDHPALDTTKGERHFQIVDRATGEVVRRVDMGAELDETGYPHMSSAVRPMTLSPDARYAYLQVSFFHGFVEYDLVQDRVTRVANLPISDEVEDLPRERYLLDSAHHGIAMNPAGTDLCVAGTMSDYATIVSPETFRHKGLVRSGKKPYWATPSADGQHCYVSWSGDDKVSAISYETGQEVGSVQVGDHPQRMRLGQVPAGWRGGPAA
ncbi:putative pyrroloquinoline-quinone binding quinoprotein [Saccharopolyspora erythraea NRRL 2338]|uniref:Serine/threonine protein kinase n=2 Tax=Saccharopolyspora erythraea TaxID=1836 RepID=A4FKJ4_SACEN|nr:PQQ-binding-like beta-propeller repeat protein [Saccharopolyspora erythraea]EQD82266.1 serine/threonine protein kinase [Saccharopolyspora erythraea D]PFG98207.1 putative pyrroloquinoline-quinone binding quinoprotein [Saccharopolyspora erythraea NRRL 2338]QRK88306.1 PQQ-binding-like beta-propeller repeat protein [Saccharopolyspora erythraea]CAM04569.1 serine/threonine protein kinase [Saccharopolyspora erythraea NRRL 2338]